MKRTILLLGDIIGKGCVGVRMLMRHFEGHGYEVLALPTAMISNILSLSRCAKLDTTEYLLESLEAWRALGIGYDALYIGYITGLAQAQALCGIADEARRAGALVVLDPILGDDGQAYRSVTQEQVQGMRLLCGHADLITPNITEACLIAGVPYDSGAKAGDALCAALGAPGRGVLITGARNASGDAVLGVDGDGARFNVPFVRVPGKHFGTGDRFTALLLDALIGGRALPEAAQAAAQGVYQALLCGTHED